MAELKAGRELDAEISAKVFGKPVIGWEPAFCPEGTWCFIPAEHDDYANQPVFVDCCDGDHSDCDSDFLGEKRFFERTGHGHSCCDVVPCYSSEVSAAFSVVERMRELGWWCQMRTPWGGDDEGDGYWAGFTPQGVTGWNGRPDHWTKADTMPEAICRAALEAIKAKP